MMDESEVIEKNFGERIDNARATRLWNLSENVVRASGVYGLERKKRDKRANQLNGSTNYGRIERRDKREWKRLG